MAKNWNITDKISCVVTNSAANTKVAICIIGINTTKACNIVCNIVNYFKQSVKVKDKLEEIQMQTKGF